MLDHAAQKLSPVHWPGAAALRAMPYCCNLRQASQPLEAPCSVLAVKEKMFLSTVLVYGSDLLDLSPI